MNPMELEVELQCAWAEILYCSHRDMDLTGALEARVTSWCYVLPSP